MCGLERRYLAYPAYRMQPINLFSNPPIITPPQGLSGPMYFGSLSSQEHVLGGSELNAHDQEIESWYVLVSSTLSSARDLIVNGIISGLKFLGNLVSKLTPLVVHLASSLVNFVTNLYGIFQSGSTGFYRAILVASLFTSFASFITGIGEVLSQSNYSWLPSAAQSVAKEFISELKSESLFVTSNSDESTNPGLSVQSWTKIGICGIIATLLGGLGLTKRVNWKDLVTGCNVLGSANKAFSTVQGCADFFLREVLGIELEADYAACQELESLVKEGAELQNYDAAHYIQHPDDHHRLLKFSSKIVDVTKRPVSRDATQRYNTTRSLLVQMYKVLSEKLSTVNVILASKRRQATVGVFLSGPPGVGKSSLCDYVSREVGKVLNYNPSIYTLNRKQDGFYEPYGGQSFGVFNEWMALRSEDPLLRDLNLIFSGDPMNFEGAALECKNQPNKLKLAYLTANIDDPNLTEVMNAGAAEAVWDRLYHIRVEDPNCKGRKAPNPHRKPDFSHLKFRKVNHIDHKAIRYGDYITMKEVLNRLIGRCASAETDYINYVLTECAPDESVKESLLKRRIELELILAINSPYDAEFVRSNGWGRDFFCYRFQGTAGSGKSTLMERVAREMSSIFSYSIQYSRSLDEFQPDKSKPLIYCMDDWVEACDYNPFIRLVNQTHERSLFMIASNTVISRCNMPWTFTELREQAYAWQQGFTRFQPWDATKFAGPLGVLRRLGLQGMIRSPSGEIIATNESYSKTFTFGEYFTVRDAYGVCVTREYVVNQMFSDYRRFLASPGNILVVDSLPPVMKPPVVSIEAPSAGDLIDTLQSPTAMFSAYMGTHSTVKFSLSQDLIRRAVSPQATLQMWLIPADTPRDRDSIRELFLRMCTLFERVAPDEALLVTVDGYKFYYFNHVAHIYSDAKFDNLNPIWCDGEDLLFHRDVETCFRITAEDYVLYKNRQFNGAFRELSLSEIIIVDRYVQNILSGWCLTSVLFHNRLNSVMATHARNQNTLGRRLMVSFKSHPVFWVACSLLVFVGTGYGIYNLVNKIMGPWGVITPPASANAVDAFTFSDKTVPYLERVFPIRSNENTFDMKSGRNLAARKIRANENTFDSKSGRNSGARRVRANEDLVERVVAKSERVFKEAGLSLDTVRDDIHSFLTDYSISPDEEGHMSVLASDMAAKDNALVVMAQSTRDFGTPKSRFETINAIYSNMVSRDEIIEQKATALETVHSTLNKVYYLLINQRGGRCYGIGLFGRYILTVSHMFERQWDRCTVQSAGFQYPAQCVYLDRERDLSVVFVNDKTFPTCKSTQRFFCDDGRQGESLYGYFLRATPEFQVMGGYLDYYPTTTYPLKDKNNPLFCVSEKLIVFAAIAVNKIRDFVHKGDCGFPLLAPDQSGQYKIVGLHNAFADSEKVYFGSFTIKDHHDFLENAMRAVGSNMNNPDLDMDVVHHNGLDEDFLLPVPYVKALEELRPEGRYPDCTEKLDILGYSQALNLVSKPSLKIHYLDIPGLKTPNTKLPAAFSMDHVTNESALVKDAFGASDTLFTQCVKYDRQVGYSFDIDILREAAYRVMEDTHLRYGDCRWLRMHEVINGSVPGTLSAFDPRTSAGPLLKMMYGITNKLPIFTNASHNPGRRIFVFDQKSQPAQMVRKHYDTYCQSLLNNGPPPLVISKDCAKVELLTAEKAAAGKVRLFNEIDLSINMVLKKFFGDLQDKVIATHESNPIKMGMNPYKHATSIWHAFSRIDGNVVSTDFSGFDKQIPSILIYIFCITASRCYRNASRDHKLADIESLYTKLYLTLTFSIHTCRGTVYMVDRGNESGTFVTTLLNSVAVRTLTMYTLVRKWREIFLFTPTLRDLLAEYEEVIYGDDRSLKTSHVLPVSQLDLVDDSAKFGLKCTPAKTSGAIDFCSRSLCWDPVSQVCFPALKEESVLAQVRWFTSLERSQVLDNIDNCLFEAALHPEPELFSMLLDDVRLICNHLHIRMSDVHFLSRDLIRRRFIAYVRDDAEYTWLTQQVTRDSELFNEYADAVVEYRRALNTREQKRSTDNSDRSPESLKRDQIRIGKYVSGPRTAIMPNPEDNPISAVLEALQACRIPDRPVEDYFQEDDKHGVRVALLGKEASAVSTTKKNAKSAAYKQLYKALQGDFSARQNAAQNIIAKARVESDRIAKQYMYASIQTHLGGAVRLHLELDKPVVVLSKDTSSLSDRISSFGHRYGVDEHGDIYYLSETSRTFKYQHISPIYLAQPGTVEIGSKILVGVPDTTSNMDPGTHTSANLVQDTISNPGLGTIPQIPNVVPVTETVPAMVNNAPPTMAAFEPLIPHMNLNPSGPPNMLSAGAIGFDIKDLAYNQFLDTDTVQTIVDQLADGSIVFQIPYDPMSSFVNRYAQAYVSMHERYAGDLEFRFTVLGNQTYSGFIGLCWQPRKVDGKTMALSEAMKYNYVAESINQPFSCIFHLGDARQTKFWRSTSDTAQDDIDNRPHLVCFVMLQTESPLKEHTNVRVRIASKLSRSFQVSNPLLKPVTPSGGGDKALGLVTQDSRRLLGQLLIPSIVRPYYLDTSSFRLVVDGNTFLPPVEYHNSDYSISNWTYSPGYLSIASETTKDCQPPFVAFLTKKLPGPNSEYVGVTYIDSSRCPFIYKNWRSISKQFYVEVDKNFDNPSELARKISLLIKGRYSIYYNIPTEFKVTVTHQRDGEDPKIQSTTFAPNVTALVTVVTDDGSMQILSTWASRVTWYPDEDGKDSYLRTIGFDLPTITQVKNVVYNDPIEAMPTGWRHLAVTPDIPYVAVEGLVSSHCPSHPSLISLISSLGVRITDDQCLQVELSDYESARPITTCRYLPDRKIVVINTAIDAPLFATSLRPCERMFITGVSVVERSTNFPETPMIGSFADNKIHSDVALRQFRPSLFH